MMTASLVATVDKEDALPSTIRLRDTCQRPKVTYNERYDPFKTPPADLDPQYSLYAYIEPLHDDRPLIIARIPSNHVLTDVVRRPRTK